MSLVIGVDVGGTKTTASVVDADGRTGAVQTLATPAAAGPTAVLDTIHLVVRRCLDAALARDAGERLVALGIGTAGVVDVDRGTIVSATDVMPGWPGTDVATGLRERLAADGTHLAPGAVRVLNDVDAHAVGEVWCGAAAGARVALVVAVGTGVGASVVIDGVPLRGAHHLAGEIGHVPTPGADGLPCGCGRTGHLEALASGPALYRHYLRLGGDPAVPDTRGVVARATAGELVAVRAVRESAQSMGRALAGVCTVLDPEVVVVGGGMAGAGPLWWSALDGALRAEVVPPLAGLRVVPAALGPLAAVVGAAHRARSQLDPSLLDSSPNHHSTKVG